MPRIASANLRVLRHDAPEAGRYSCEFSALLFRHGAIIMSGGLAQSQVSRQRDTAINYGNARTLFPRLAVEQRIQEAVRTDRLTNGNRSTTVNIKSLSV
jgi:hypothetical protein